MKATSYIPHIDDIRPYWEQVTGWIRTHLETTLGLLTTGYEYVIYPDAETADISFDIPEHALRISVRIEGHGIFQDAAREKVLRELQDCVEYGISVGGKQQATTEH